MKKAKGQCSLTKGGTPKQREIRFTVNCIRRNGKVYYRKIDMTKAGADLLEHCATHYDGHYEEQSVELRDIELREFKRRISWAADMHGYKAVFSKKITESRRR